VLGTPQAITTNATAIGAVISDAPASNAGLEVGDKIVSIDGTSVKTWKDLTTLIRYKIGQKTEITYIRDGKEKNLVLTPEINHEKGFMGIGISNLELAQVMDILPNSPAAKSKLKVGDVIDRVIGMGEGELSRIELIKYIKKNPGKLIVLGIKRYSESRYISESNIFHTAKVPLKIEKVGKFENIDIGEFEGSSIIICDDPNLENFPVKNLDKIIKINGKKVTPKNINEKISGLSAGNASVTIERIEGKIVKKAFTTNVVLTVVNSGRIGATLYPAQQTVKYHALAAVLACPKTAYKEFLGVLHILRMLVQKKLGLKSLAGPVGIARITGDAAKAL